MRILKESDRKVTAWTYFFPYWEAKRCRLIGGNK